MSSPSPLGRFLDALDALPPLSAVVFHGCPTGPELPVGTLVVTAPLSTSTNPAVALATGGPELFAVLTRTGRSTAALSARPQDDEVVLRPGTFLTAVGAVRLGGDNVLVHVLDELVPAGEPVGEGVLPQDMDGLVAALRSALERAQPVADVPGGRYAGPLPVTPVPQPSR